MGRVLCSVVPPSVAGCSFVGMQRAEGSLAGDDLNERITS